MRSSSARAVLVAVLFVAAVMCTAVPARATTLPTLSVGSASVLEGDTGTHVMKVDVALSEPATTKVTVGYAVNSTSYPTPPGDAATSPSDFVAKSGTLTFAVNAKTGVTPVEKTLSITVNGDAIAESNETFLIFLGAPTGATVSDGLAVGTIINDDPAAPNGIPSVGVGDVEVFSGVSGPVHKAQVDVALSHPLTVASTVHYTVSGVTAVRSVDFTGPTSGVLTFPANTDEKTITISALPDQIVEDGRCVSITLSAPSAGLVLGRATGQVMIRDSSYRGCAGPRVTVAGDSITNLSTVDIRAAFSDAYNSRVEGFPGETIAQVTPFVQAQVATQPTASIVNLGTNDMGTNNQNWQHDLDQVVSIVGSVPCVEFVTIYAEYYANMTPPNTIGAQINAYLVNTVVPQHSNVHIVDWDAAVNADPSLISSFDHVHPTPAGRAWIASHLRSAVGTDC